MMLNLIEQIEEEISSVETEVNALLDSIATMQKLIQQHNKHIAKLYGDLTLVKGRK
jgi:peptidoglycan hydrolase CwlO-like protein